MRIHPTRVKRHTFRQRTAAAPERLADAFEVTVLETLNDHEQHERSVAGTGRNADRGAFE